jgi:cytoskeletal protein CcmA (bactofilin family)
MTEIKRTLIEEGTELKGTLTSTCPIVVMGRVEGEMTGPSVEVTESGILCGKAKVNALSSRGELAGEFDAEVVELSGRVRDKTIIRAQSLEVSLKRDDGRIQMVFGDCELAVGDAPDKAKAIARALSNGHGPKAAPAANGVETNGVPTPDAQLAAGDKSGRRGKKSEEVEQQPES